MSKKLKTLQIRIDDETDEFLNEVADGDRRSTSFIVRTMIDSFRHLSADEIIDKLRKVKKY